MKCSAARLFILIIALVLFSGCRKGDPTPELRDNIYSDLQKRVDDLKKEIEEEYKKQAELESKIARSEPNSLERKQNSRDLLAAQSYMVDLKQRFRYFEIRSKRRELEDRVMYKMAFEKGEEWPDPREYSDYLVNKQLREAPKNWSARVPKLQDRLPSSVKKPKKSDKNENNSEG